ISAPAPRFRRWKGDLDFAFKSSNGTFLTELEEFQHCLPELSQGNNRIPCSAFLDPPDHALRRRWPHTRQRQLFDDSLFSHNLKLRL
ncbi:hypothetical protein GE21DRAFT_1198418, partial [Neurospora crassa]